MKPLEYNLVRFYIKEIYRLKKISRHLSIIVVGGLLAEFIARELAQDYKTVSMPDILNRLQKEGKINQEQRKAFDEIKEIRKEYIHLDAERQSHAYIMNIEKKIKKEFSWNVKATEENYESFESMFKFVLKTDSKKMMELLNKLIKSFHPELFQK